jgi:hypothetical protein
VVPRHYEVVDSLHGNHTVLARPPESRRQARVLFPGKPGWAGTATRATGVTQAMGSAFVVAMPF